MPFVTQERRKELDDFINGSDKELNLEPGDLCYLYYKPLVDNWKKNPRWTTAHMIYKNVLDNLKLIPVDGDDRIALQLAWQVFFNLYVMPYEVLKREENGDI